MGVGRRGGGGGTSGAGGTVMSRAGRIRDAIMNESYGEFSFESKNPRRRWSAGARLEDLIDGRGSGVLRLDRFEAHDDPGVVAEDALFDAVGVLEITSLDVELGLEAGSTAHHFTGAGETDDRDD